MEAILGPLEIEFLYSLVLSLGIGYIIGAERESRGKDAGISTHILVITGSMLFTFLSVAASNDLSDPTRIAAQIVTGIGFLGAGLILKDGTSVKNLTTAASLWAAGAIGMTIGFGFYVVALIAGVVIMLVPRVPHLRAEVKEYHH